MEAVLDFLLMPLLGLVSAALCIGILFCLNHIANGYSSPPLAISLNLLLILPGPAAGCGETVATLLRGW